MSLISMFRPRETLGCRMAAVAVVLATLVIVSPAVRAQDDSAAILKTLNRPSGVVDR